MYSGGATRALPRVGFPIRTSRHHWLVSTSTGLIAAAHVLHRLLAPRHPPCALIFLIRKNTCVATMEFSRCTRATPTEKTAASSNGLSKLNSVKYVEVDVFLGDLVTGRRKSFHQRARSLRSKSSGFPRKEVIQPQLPLRLPCYDFTPVTNPTFDGSLPCGLGHRLRVLPASVV
jgi:hypothetical protein